MQKVTVEIPEPYLLQVAVAGEMGDGHLLASMQAWAEQECVRCGLEQNMRSLMTKRLEEMRLRLKNVIGDDLMTEIDTAIITTIDKLRRRNDA